jgi:general secretion pathway protein F
MKAFRYQALSAAGRRETGVSYAVSSSALRDRLIEARLHPVWIRPALFHRHGALKLSAAEAARFGRDLAQLMSSGMAIGPTLSLLEGRESARVAAVIRDVRQRLIAGEPLSQALGAASGAPARLLQSLARGGEASGRQADVLAAGAASLSTMDQLRSRLITLSLYPAFVIAVALGAIGIYAYAVLPALEPAFAGLGQDVPPQTQAVLTFGKVVRAVAPVTLCLLLAATALVALVRPARRAAINALSRLAMKGRASPLRDFLFANLAARLSVLLQAGVPLAAAWRLARDPVTLDWLSAALARCDDRLMEGARLSDVLRLTPGAPPDLLHYVAMGEQSGGVAEALETVSALLAARAQETVERLLSILTPLVIIIVGSLVGLITMMVFQGLLAIGDAVAV